MMTLEAMANVLQTLEVAFARVYNWDVAQRRKEREAGETEGKGKSSPLGRHDVMIVSSVTLLHSQQCTDSEYDLGDFECDGDRPDCSIDRFKLFQ